ncbi:DNA primase large subunit PriL [Thermococcus sp.]|uniref:DNA primase large subunit PriL n=1 Tax=Thermococcus sp. TaxID=35749 RepID=UPI0025DE66CE|nr:DNA primase large subunit PriL [Thermococcus sp.]
MLDPFGREAQELIRREFGDLLVLLEKIPGSVSLGEALSLVRWMLESKEPPEELLTVDSLDELMDLFRFYALLGALAFSPYGLEVEFVREATSKLYRARIERKRSLEESLLKVKPAEGIPERDRKILERAMDRSLPEEEREKLRLKYRIPLSEFIGLWEGSLKDVYIRGGYAYLRWNDVLKLWEMAFERRFDRAVSLLSDVRDELPEFYERLAEELEKLAGEYFKERLEKLGKVGAKPLRFELFPPCVKEALKGVPAGMRNYAITVLLTSFLSYARLCPNPPRKDVRIKDCVSDLRVVEEEILPVIIEAGNRCKPPLFEDQPHEIKNIWYHLGFGLTDKPTLEDSGNSTWYFPPNCDKIRANAPQLCKPDKHCRGIKNPLTYYLRRLAREEKSGENQGGDNGG